MEKIMRKMRLGTRKLLFRAAIIAGILFGIIVISLIINAFSEDHFLAKTLAYADEKPQTNVVSTPVVKPTDVDSGVHFSMNDIIWEGDEFYYTGNPHKVTAKYVDVNGDENPAAITQNKTNTEVGKYIATAVVEDSNYTVNGATINHAYEIKWYDGAPDATVSGTKG